jgi:outer membrane lipoprotein LolB
MKSRFFAIFLMFVGGAGCSLLKEAPPLENYSLAAMQRYQQRDHWVLDGRLALVDEKNSLSVSINWRHDDARDDIELVGPLGQGRVKVVVTPGQVIVDDGEVRSVYTGRAERVLRDQLGVEIPVSSLKYWVQGVNDPEYGFSLESGGFYQDGWLVRYRELQQVDAQTLPRKMSAEKAAARIKLIVDQWTLL